MTVAYWLVRLYPVAFRERWGADLAEEARRSGPRSWPNLLVNAADVWLHPTVWPARSPVQRQSRATAMAVMVTCVGWFVAHLTVEDTRGFPRALDVCAALVVVGLLLVAPRPAPSALATIGGRLLHRLAGPAALGVVVVAVVHGTDGPFTSPIRLALLICWWGSWTWAVVQVARTVADLDPDQAVHPPTFRLGIRVLAAAAAATGVTQSAAAVAASAPASATIGLCLLAAPLFLRPPETAS